MKAFRTLITGGALAGAAAIALTLAPAAPSAAQGTAQSTRELIEDLPPQDWLKVTAKTERGHINGNPDAEAQLIEFISYTCSHCADFAKQGDSTLDVAAVGPGFVSVEVRPVIRNYLDVVVSLLAQCGPPETFKERHRAFLYSQDTWLTKATKAPQGQQQVWASLTPQARIIAANALGLDDILRDRGYSMPKVADCLRDNAAVAELLANDKADREQFQITGTPTFALDGAKLTDAYDWPTLATVLQERFRPEPQ